MFVTEFEMLVLVGCMAAEQSVHSQWRDAVNISYETFDGAGTFGDFLCDMENALSMTSLTERSDPGRVAAVNMMGSLTQFERSAGCATGNWQCTDGDYERGSVLDPCG